MTTNYTPLLGFALPTQGELDGAWGDVTNDEITSLLESSIAGFATASVTSANWTLTTTGSGLANQARMAILIPTGTPGVSRNIVAPSSSKTYVVINQSNAAVVLKGPATTGLTIATGSYVLASGNGSDFVQVGKNGTVTAASVVSANGFAGTVATADTTPAITLSTSITGVLKGNGTALSAATAGTDYLAPPAGTAILKANSSGALANATSGTDYAPGTSALATGIVKSTTTTGALTIAAAGTDYLAPPSGTAILKANSGGALANATAGTDYVAPGTATTFTAKQTFTGAATVIGASLQAVLEKANVSATAATGTIAFYVNTAVVWYYTTNASANWTVNIAGDASNTLASLMAVGESLTCAFLVTQGATPYYNSAVQIDGTVTGVTTKWQGGAAPTFGNASNIDVYTYTIIKTAATPTYTVFASQTQFG
jgi:hypothetical protein